jgi:RHS repeat-associated protein
MRKIDHFKMIFVFCFIVSRVFYSTATPINPIAFSSTGGALTVGPSFPFINNGFYPAATPPNIHDKITNQVKLYVDHASTVYVGVAYDYTFTIRIQYYTTTGVASPLTVDLRVAYDPSASTTYQDNSTYRFQDGQNMSIQIMNINDNILGPGHPVPTPSAGNLRLEESILIDRYTDFVPTPPSVSSTPLDKNSDGINDHLNITWGSLSGAEDYEIEWTYVDNYDAQTGSTIASKPLSALNYDFTNNNTRVRISAQTAGPVPSYELPLVFEQGYIIYRIRGIGRAYPNTTNEIFGSWSLANSGPMVPLSSTNYYLVANTHEGNKPWQINTTYAEEGKNKEVVQYFDGTSRDRQSVTKLNISNHQNAVAGESIYDYEGRPAITTLPAPTGQSVLKYYPNLNMNSGATAPYSASNFDADAGSCAVSTGEMSSTSGSSNYFSTANPNKTGYQAFVPDAKLNPFIQKEFTPDNTGRISRQGGAGPALKIGSGHETKYYYGQPQQVELDRLFGSEVGWKNHYKKNVIIDANGQISISYLDMAGKVIASGLVGENPSNMQPLANKTSATLTEDLFAKDANGKSTVNTPDINGTSVSFVTQLVVPTTGTYTFAYDITSPQYTVACGANSLCFDCTYDMEIDLINDCGNNIFPTSGSLSRTMYVGQVSAGAHSLDVSCNTPITFSNTGSPISISLTPGTYLLSKTLTVNRDDYNYYLQNYLASASNCIRQESAFVATEMGKIDETKCHVTYKECIDLLGTKDDYILSGKGTAEDWDRAYAECKSLKIINPNNEEGLCRSRYKLLLADVTPGGQYAQYLDSAPTAKINPGMYPLSILNTNNKLSATHPDWRHPTPNYFDEKGELAKIYLVKLPDGNFYPTPSDPRLSASGGDVNTSSDGRLYVLPDKLNDVEDFIKFWQNSWATALVQYHPEFCYYLACSQNLERNNGPLSSEEFDQYLLSFKTYNDASAASFINSSSSSTSIDPMTQDPFFKNISTSASAYNHFYIEMGDYLTHASPSSMSLKQLSAATTRCGTKYNNSLNDCGCQDFGSTTVSCLGGVTLTFSTETLDKEWLAYVRMYLGKKQKIQQRYAVESYMKHNSCTKYNDCIGKDNFIPFNTDLYDLSSLSNWMVLNTSPAIYYPLSTTLFGFPGIPFLDITQQCGYNTFYLYKTKTRRYGDETDLPKVDQTNTSDADFNQYLQTGQCPIVRDLQFFLDRLAKTFVSPYTALSNTSTASHVQQFPEFTKLLYSNLLSASTTSYTDFSWTPIITTSSGGSVLTGSFVKPTGTADAVTITMTIPSTLLLPKGSTVASGGSTFAWTDVTGFQQLFFTTGNYSSSPVSYNFRITAEVLLAGKIYYVPIDGTCGFPITGCNFSKKGRPNELAVNVMNLMSALSAHGDLTSTSGVPITNTTLVTTKYDDLTTDLIKANILPGAHPVDPYLWRNVSTATNAKFEIYSTAHSNKFIIEFTSYDPPTFPITSLDQLRYFDDINIDPNNTDNGFILHGYYAPGGTAANSEITITAKLSVYDYTSGTPNTHGQSMGFYGYPIPLTCQTKQHRTRDDMEKFLDDVYRRKLYEKYNPTATTTITRYLNSSPKFTALLKSYLGNAADYAMSEPKVVDDQLTADIIEVSSSNTNNPYKKVCEINLKYIDLPTTNPPGLQMIEGLDDIQVDYTLNADGYYYGFYAIAHIGTKTYRIKGTSTCFQIKDCDAYTCRTQLTNPDGSGKGASMSNKVATEGIDCSLQYQKYVALWSVINNLPDPPDLPVGEHIYKPKLMTYEEFMSANLCACIDKYLKYLSNIVNHIEILTWVYTTSSTLTTKFWKDGDIGNPNISTGQGGNGGDNHGNGTNLAEGREVKHYMWNIYGFEVFVQKFGCKPDGEDGGSASGFEATFCVPQISPYGVFAKLNKEAPCKDFLENVAKLNAKTAYNKYLKGVTDDFERNYYQKCMQPIENFSMNYDIKEYQYTLYYYDQAGNLVRTVPPAGVNPLSSATDLQNVTKDRTYNTKTIYPAHNLATTYKFNSLNQLIRQGNPDQDNIERWNVASSTGLPSGFVVTSTHFVSASTGYLTGNTGGYGYIYKTTNAGAAWTQVDNVTLNDFQKVYFIKNLSSSTGFAITKDGLLAETFNGGVQWFIVPSSIGWNQQLNDLHFYYASGNIYGLVVGNSGFCQRTSDGGSTWTSITGLSGDIKSIDFKNTATPTDGVAVTYDGSQSHFYITANFGSTWTPQTDIKAIDLNAVYFYTSTNGYAAGKDGLILKTSDGGTTWAPTPGNLKKEVKKLYFESPGTGSIIGLALTIDGQLWSTADGGNTWVQRTTLGIYKDFSFYSATNGYAVGLNGLISKIDIAGMKIINVTSSIKTNLYTANFINYSSGYVAGNGSAPAYGPVAGAGNYATIIYINGVTNTTDPDPLTPGTSFSVDLLPYISDDNIHAYTVSSFMTETFTRLHFTTSGASFLAQLLTSNGKIIEWTQTGQDPTAAGASPSFTQLMSGTTFSDMHWTTANIYAVNGASTASIYKWSVATACGGSCSPTTYSIPTTNFVKANALFAYDDNNIFVVGNAGSICSAIATGGSPTLTDNTLKVKPLALNDIHVVPNTSQAYAVGVNGSIYMNSNFISSSTWSYFPSGIKEDLNGVKFYSSTSGTIVGNKGTMIQLSFSGSAWIYYYPPFAVAQNPDYTSLMYSGSDIYVTASKGTLLQYTALNGWGVAALPKDVQSTDLINIDADNSGDIAIVGKNGLILNYTTTSASWAIITDMATPLLKKIRLNEDGIGFIVGDKGMILKSANGGDAWKVLKVNLPAVDFKSSMILSDNTIVVVGTTGTVIRTIDGGATWSAATLSPTTANDLNDIYMAMDISGSISGYIVGNGGTMYQSAASDGSSWTALSSPTSQNLYGVYKTEANVMACGAAGTILQYNSITFIWSVMHNTSGVNWTTYDLYNIFILDKYTAYAVGANGTVLKYYILPTPVWTVKITGTTNTLYALNFKVPNKSFIAGNNFFNTVFDESPVFSSLFWYDKLGRLIISQNSKQFYLTPTKAYSYTSYDALGRISLVGQIAQSTPVENLIVADQIDPALYSTWMNSSTAARTEVTRTYYDAVIPGSASTLGTIISQDNLRSRVASSTFEDIDDANDLTYNSASHYSYDVHGNVKKLLQEIPELAAYGNNARYKSIDYTYDLVSNKVNTVDYQNGQADQFHHKYQYDADNRLTRASTSRDGIIWDQDANYFYYDHGPLARAEIGDNLVQGMDYSYTLQGWLKGVNSDILNPENDMGKDGFIPSGGPSNPNVNFGRDLFGYSLGYYKNTTDNDYEAIGWSSLVSKRPIAELQGTGGNSDLYNDRKDLYNGNISHMVTSLTLGSTVSTQGVGYQYDQLNRLIQTRAWQNINTGTNQWGIGTTYVPAFQEDFTYDPNGNILTLKRKGIASNLPMDDLTYQYNWAPAGIYSNRLLYVDDAVTSTYTDDIKDQAPGNYDYDKSGNLIKDNIEQIQNINWSVSNKIKFLQRTTASSKPDIQFAYDPSGNRIKKKDQPKPLSPYTEATTYYVHDATGNIMATYSLNPGTPRTTAMVLADLKIVAPGQYNNFITSTFLGNPSLTPALLAQISTQPNWISMLQHSTHQSNLCTTISSLGTTVRNGLPDLQWANYYYIHNGYSYMLNLVTMYGSPTDVGNLFSGYITASPAFLNQLALVSPPAITNLYNFFFPGDPFGCGPNITCQTSHLQTGVPAASLGNAIVTRGFQPMGMTAINQVELATPGTAWANMQAVFPIGQIVAWIVSNRTLCGMYTDLLAWDPAALNAILTSAYGSNFVLNSLYGIDPNEFLNNAITYFETQCISVLSGAYTWDVILNMINTSLGSGVMSGVTAMLPPLYVYSPQEWEMYGSSRLGSVNYNANGNAVTSNWLTGFFYRSLGYKYYEGTNHLGNVLMNFTDRLKPQTSGGGVVSYRLADAVKANDYYAFGSPMPSGTGGRTWSATTAMPFRFGFNGKEKDDEVKGSGNSIDFGARIYDSRLGRWLSLDPLQKKYPNLSPYNCVENNPIYFGDKSGKDAVAEICDNTVTISATIYIYGSGATAQKASDMQSQVMQLWSGKDGKGFSYVDPKTKQVYNVKFNIEVKTLVKSKGEIKSSDNFVKLKDETKDEVISSTDGNGWHGEWGNDEDQGTYAHETGHLLGFVDLYYMTNDVSAENYAGVDKNELMGKEAHEPSAKVTQKDINAIAKYSLDNQKKDGTTKISLKSAELRKDDTKQKQPEDKKQ